jgi:hypothetical protein
MHDPCKPSMGVCMVNKCRNTLKNKHLRIKRVAQLGSRAGRALKGPIGYHFAYDTSQHNHADRP